MLVLTRRKNESLIIRDDIIVRILDIGPKGVKIGIDAPKEVKVDRAEIHARKAMEGKVPRYLGRSRSNRD